MINIKYGELKIIKSCRIFLRIFDPYVRILVAQYFGDFWASYIIGLPYIGFGYDSFICKSYTDVLVLSSVKRNFILFWMPFDRWVWNVSKSKVIQKYAVDTGYTKGKNQCMAEWLQ